jgi:hypothetical protein
MRKSERLSFAINAHWQRLREQVAALMYGAAPGGLDATLILQIDTSQIVRGMIVCF